VRDIYAKLTLLSQGNRSQSHGWELSPQITYQTSLTITSAYAVAHDTPAAHIAMAPKQYTARNFDRARTIFDGEVRDGTVRCRVETPRMPSSFFTQRSSADVADSSFHSGAVHRPAADHVEVSACDAARIRRGHVTDFRWFSEINAKCASGITGNQKMRGTVPIGTPTFYALPARPAA